MYFELFESVIELFDIIFKKNSLKESFKKNKINYENFLREPSEMIHNHNMLCFLNSFTFKSRNGGQGTLSNIVSKYLPLGPENSFIGKGFINVRTKIWSLRLSIMTATFFKLSYGYQGNLRCN